MSTPAAFNQADNDGRTLLQVAQENGHKEVVEVLEAAEVASKECTAALLEAARDGLLDVVQYAVEAGASLDATNVEGKTAIQVAAQYGHADVVNFLAARGNSSPNPLMAVFWQEVKEGHADMVEYLLGAGVVEVDQTDASGATALSVAAQHGHVEVAMVLLEARASLVHYDDKGLTALNHAAQNGYFGVVRLLLGAMPPTRARAEGSVMAAAMAGDFQMMLRLVRARAAVDEVDEDGITPLWHAYKNHHVAVATLLAVAGAALNRTDKDGWTLLLKATLQNEVEWVRLLVLAQAVMDHATNEGKTALYFAASNGRAEVVQLLLSAPTAAAVVNQAKEDGWTPLHTAASNGYTEVVRLLLSAQAAMDQATNDGETALYFAASNGRAEVVQLLLSAPTAAAVVDQAEKGGWTLLHTAASGGHTEVVRLLLSAQAAMDQATNDGKTALYFAASNGRAEVVQLLLSAPTAAAVVNQAEKDGWTPLHRAASNGHTEVVRLLLSAQAAMDQAKNDGKTALYVAASNGRAEVVQLLLSAPTAAAVVNQAEKGGWTPLHAAASGGHTEVVRLLLSAQALVNAVDTYGDTPLHTAARNDHRQMVRLLASAQAALDQPNKAGRTPLSVAFTYNKLEMALMLAQAGATLSWMQSPDINEGLRMASAEGHVELTTLLLSAQAEPNQADKDGRSLLWRACLNGQLDIAKVLLQSQADVNNSAKDGSTPMLIAARDGHSLVVKWLLSVRADHQQTDNEGRSPLWVAVQYQHPDSVEALLEGGADANFQKPNNGQTAFMCAAATGNTTIIKLLRDKGARDDVRDKNGFTTYYHADPAVEQLFAPPRLEELLELCGDPDTTDTATLADIFQADPALVNAGDKYLHWTVLMEAVLFGRAETVAWLVSHGADPSAPLFCGLTVAFWAELRGDVAIKAALGDGGALSAAEVEGLAYIREAQSTPEGRDLLVFDGRSGGPKQKDPRPRLVRRSANLTLQDRMAHVTTDTEIGRFYPDNYRCPISLYRFLTTDTDKFLPEGGEGAVAQLTRMAMEGRKVVAVHIAAPNQDLQVEEIDCLPEDVFALFCYTYDSVAYRHSNEAMRNWNQPDQEVQAALELWRPFIFHCRRALQRLPQRGKAVVYRGIPMAFSNKFGKDKYFVWPSFSSTSESLKVAQNFTDPNHNAVIFIITGESGRRIHYCSRFPAEAEVLFPPNLCLTTKWLAKASVLGDTKVMLDPTDLPQQHRLSDSEAEKAAVVVVYCVETARRKG
eukprot:EG_transcript_424